MRTLATAVAVCAILAVAAGDAHALTYADGVTLDSSYYASIQNLSGSAGGTSETDDSRATFGQSSGTVTLILVTYDFPTTTLGAGDHRAYLIVDSDIKGTVVGRVTNVNGTAATTLSVTLSGTGNSDKYYGLDFTLAQATDVTSISFLIALADASQAGQLIVDAVALPEPGTWLLFGLGAAGLGAWSVRKRKRRGA